MSCERCGSTSNGRLCASCEQMDRVERNNEHQKRSDGGVTPQVDDNAEVIQGRLGWESGDISEADPSNLKPHSKNTEIYGDTDDIGDLDATFKESIAEKGVLEPLVITNGKEIISGHRRWLAARDAGLGSVPVRYSEFDDELAEREALIEFNRQREKTPGQIVNEFEEMLEIEQEKAKEREKEAGRVGGKGSENFHDPSQGRAKDKAAEKVNADVSGRTLEKGKKVKDKAESDDEPAEVQEAAREAWDGLQSGEESFNGAYEQVKEVEEKVESEQNHNDIAESTPSSGDEEEAPVAYDVERGDWWELPRESGDPHLLFCGDTATAEFVERVEEATVEFAFADPPYNADAAEWDSGFEWEHDYLNDAADVVAVTPGIESIKDFMCLTQMSYEWSVTAWIDNGMTRGALGFGNWIYVALFTEEESIHCESQDIARVSVRTSESDETDHKGRKPSELMEWLLERFVSGGTIVDPFLGSGTTLLTAEKFTESRVIGGELSPEFCEQILRRWEEMGGVEPEMVR